MRVMMKSDGFIENTRRRKGSDPATDSFRLEKLENFNYRTMVVVKATPEELKELEAILEDRRKGKLAPRQEAEPKIQFYSKAEFADEEPVEQPDFEKPEPTQYPMKKPKAKKVKDSEPTGSREVL